jgi:hypothetical protein
MSAGALVHQPIYQPRQAPAVVVLLDPSAGVVSTFMAGARQGRCISCRRGGRRAVRAEDAQAGGQLREQQAEARRLDAAIEANLETLGYAINTQASFR